MYDTPPEYEILHLAPFTEMHLFYGEPVKQQMVAFMKVSGMEQQYSTVANSGWTKITEIRQEPWGSRTCTVTTIDGCFLRFFE